MVDNIRKFSNGEVTFWKEQNASIHIKAYTKPHFDPVELNSDEAREIAIELLRMADELDDSYPEK